MTIRQTCLAIGLVFSIALTAAAQTPQAKAVPARQPLTYRDSGVYGWWQPYFLESPFDYIITQGIILPGDFGPDKVTNNCSDVPHIKEWNEYLLKARAAGKRVIVVLSPGQGQPYAEPYYQALEQFLANVNHEELYAISLGEENIADAEWVAKLSEYYHRIKRKYPELPVYQWYSCSGRATARPGFSYPLLPADGWLSDEYVATTDDFEQAMLRYRLVGKPVVNIIWAAPYYSLTQGTSVPWSPYVFDGQVRVSQKYNIPTAYFCWDGPVNKPRESWPWTSVGSQEGKDLFKIVLDNIAKAKSLPEEALLNWDSASIPAKTMLEQTGEGAFAYRESYDLATDKTNFKAPATDFVERSEIRGLRHLKWEADPTRLVARSDAGNKPVVTSITNHWAAPEGQSCKLTASASVKTEPGSNAKLIFEASANGYDWVIRTSEIRDGVMTVELPEAYSEIYTRLRISGSSASSNQPLASIDWIEVRGSVAK